MAQAHGLSQRAVIAARARRHRELSRWLLVLEVGWLTLAVGPSAWRMVCACLIFGAVAGIACCGGAVRTSLRPRLASCTACLVAAVVISGPPVTAVGSAVGPVLGGLGVVFTVRLFGDAMIDLARSYDDLRSVAGWRRLRSMLGGLLAAGMVALAVVLVAHPEHSSAFVPIVRVLGGVLLASVVAWPLVVLEGQRRRIARYQGWTRPRYRRRA